MAGTLNRRRYLYAVGKRLFRSHNGAFRRLLSPQLESYLRRIARRYLLRSETVAYQRWIQERLTVRAGLYPLRAEAGLLSFVTTVWNTKVEYIKELADSLLPQYNANEFEWVILDNGSTSAAVQYLRSLQEQHKCIRLFRVENNLGIIGGMRFCLERARNRYILPLDSDDVLYPDCVRIVVSEIQRHHYPALLYTDEDKILGGVPTTAYFKPDWDPVLFLNSAYIAHLGVIDRELALRLSCYTDPNATGSHDWDTFNRFMIAGNTPVHIREILYSWRMHAQSTALNVSSKSYIHTSQQAVLDRYVRTLRPEGRYWLDQSPLFPGTPDWWIRRKHDPAPALHRIVLHTDVAISPSKKGLNGLSVTEHHVALDSPPTALKPVLKQAAHERALVLLQSSGVNILDDEWFWDSLCLLERHQDSVMIGGRIKNSSNLITEAGRYLGFGGACGCPDVGRSFDDPGYFAQMWKQHSVSAVSSQMSISRPDFLLSVLDKIPSLASIRYLGSWAGAYARRTGHRIIYTPFFSAFSEEVWDAGVPQAELDAFREANHELMPDSRFFSPHLSLERDKPFEPITDYALAA